jgi:hypothetical protein
VGEAIERTVSADTTTLRHPVGDGGMIATRNALSDEQWIDLSAR